MINYNYSYDQYGLEQFSFVQKRLLDSSCFLKIDKFNSIILKNQKHFAFAQFLMQSTALYFQLVYLVFFD